MALNLVNLEAVTAHVPGRRTGQGRTVLELEDATGHITCWYTPSTRPAGPASRRSPYTQLPGAAANRSATSACTITRPRRSPGSSADLADPRLQRFDLTGDGLADVVRRSTDAIDWTEKCCSSVSTAGRTANKSAGWPIMPSHLARLVQLHAQSHA